MPRKLFKKGVPGKEESSDIEYKPAEGEIYAGPIDILLERYIVYQEVGELIEAKKLERTFDFCVSNLVSLLQKHEVRPQLLLDMLIHQLPKVKNRVSYTSDFPHYLTLVVQAFYNMGLGSKFTIDLNGLPESKSSSIGEYLKGRSELPIHLNVNGNVGNLGRLSEHCNFTLHGNAKCAGLSARYCRFVLHGEVFECGKYSCLSEFILHNKVNYCGESAIKSLFTAHDEVVRCGRKSRNHCEFILYKEVEHCGKESWDCEFYLHDKVKVCGDWSKNCTFNLMPNAEIGDYQAGDLQSWGNVLRKMNEDGEWEEVSR